MVIPCVNYLKRNVDVQWFCLVYNVGISLFQMGIFYSVKEKAELTPSSVLRCSHTCMYFYIVKTVST